MWYPASVTTPVADEPVTMVQARLQCGLIDETEFDGRLLHLCRAARLFVERYCGVRFAPVTLAMKCDAFSDLNRLLEAPIRTVTSISYVDTAGADQTVPDTVFEPRFDELEAAIVLKVGQWWPACQPGSRITVTVEAGYLAPPEDVIEAMLLHIGSSFDATGVSKVDAWSTIDNLLCNHRRGT